MKNLKSVLKSNKILRKRIKNIKITREYNYDKKIFKKFYCESKNTENKLEYRILLLVHSLEKGMCNKKIRIFGKEKVEELIKDLMLYKKMNYDLNSTSYKMGISIIKKWIEIYETNKWTNDSYLLAKDFLRNNDANTIELGKMVYKRDFLKYKSFDYNDAISERHSARDFQNKVISNEDFDYAVEAAIKSPSACNRQMCKVYYIKNKDKKEELSKLIMGLGGFNQQNTNLFVITYDISAFSYFGERNQGYLNAGLFAMNFANALHFKNIGSCFLQWGNTYKDEKYIKKVLGIPVNEKIATVLGAGYYLDEEIIPVSYRKNKQEVSQIIDY